MPSPATRERTTKRTSSAPAGSYKVRYAVVGLGSNNGEKRFEEVDEMTSAILRFPDECLASFTSSFGASDVSAYQIVGSEGELRVDPAYEFAGDLKHRLTIKGKTRDRTFSKRDQFAPELLYFSDCVINGEEPEPSGREGLADVRIIRALYHSEASGEPVKLDEFDRDRDRRSSRRSTSRRSRSHGSCARQRQHGRSDWCHSYARRTRRGDRVERAPLDCFNTGPGRRERQRQAPAPRLPVCSRVAGPALVRVSWVNLTPQRVILTDNPSQITPQSCRCGEYC